MRPCSGQLSTGQSCQCASCCCHSSYSSASMTPGSWYVVANSQPVFSPNAEVGRPQRGPPRRAHVAGSHQTFSGRRQVHTPARVRSGAAGRALARPQKIAQHARACVCSPGARGRGAGAGGRGSACPMRGRAVHMAAGAAPLLRRARRAAVRDGHSRRAWASQTRCGPLGRAAPRRSPGRGP